MKLLFEYTLDYIKRNYRSSLAIMIAILMTSTMMSGLCGFLYVTYIDNLSYVLSETGNWHGELFDDTQASQLPIVEAFESVEATMIKGDWKAAQIDDPRRDYLVWRDANAEYWKSMPEGDIAILEGRSPVKTGEIAISKQYFEHHPDFKLGDTLELPLGDRILADGTVMDPRDAKRSDEQFVMIENITLTAVGILDVATSSTTPAYTAIGFLDTGDILPTDDLTIYLRFKNINDTYKELPKIAATVGYEQDEYGQYMLKYNTDYLLRKGVLSPAQMGLLPMLLANQMVLMFAVIGLLVVGVFVLIIHNAFALSSSARLSQLGIFASVGATPRQIKRSLLLESLMLTVIPLPIGLILGQLAIVLLVNIVNVSEYDYVLKYAVGWQSLLPAVVFTMLTVWWSALIPAKKIAKMSPIVAIRQGGAEDFKKLRGFSIVQTIKHFGVAGELAANALQARKKSYRTATISLTLSFLILSCLLCITSASTASKAVYKTQEKMWADQDVMTSLYNVDNTEDYDIITERINELEAIESASWYNTIRTVTWLSEDEFSDDFKEKGGFATLEENISQNQIPLLRDGKRRVNVTILGMDDETFTEYCATLGIDPAPFYENDRWRSILYHTVDDVGTSTKRNPVPIPFFKNVPGDTITLTETTIDSYDGDFTFDMEIAAVADQLPPVGSATFSVRYSAIQIMPMNQVRKLASNFANDSTIKVNGVIQVSDPSRITPTRLDIEQICESYFGSGDYSLFDQDEYFNSKTAGNMVVNIIFGFIVGLLAVIGLSNVWSTVRGTLNARRREFAMLRSVGLPPKGLRKMLTLEAVLLGMTPILIGLPVTFILQGIFLYVNEVLFLEWLPFLPWLPMLLYIVAVLTVTLAAYATGSQKLLGENIIDAIKIDSI